MVISACCCNRAAGLNNGLALTPPMGYNTWNAFHDEINETLIYHAADALVELGLAAAGYEYIVIDGRSKPLPRYILGWIVRRRVLHLSTVCTP